jgi:predicted sulfurtransferase
MNVPLAKVYQQFFAAFEEQKVQEVLHLLPPEKVIMTCQSGLRCTVIALSLREIGFENVYAMKGGLASLMEYLSPKTAF